MTEQKRFWPRNRSSASATASSSAGDDTLPASRRLLQPQAIPTIFIAILLLTGTTAVVRASPAQATTKAGVNAAPSNAGGEWWSTDGCTRVPDSGYHTYRAYYGTPPLGRLISTVGYYDFLHACHHHDGCYAYHWGTREQCDTWFRNDMYASCKELQANAACYNRADLYYWGVRAFGLYPYNSRDIKIALDSYL